MSNTCQLVLVSADASAASVGWAGGGGGEGGRHRLLLTRRLGLGPGQAGRRDCLWQTVQVPRRCCGKCLHETADLGQGGQQGGAQCCACDTPVSGQLRTWGSESPAAQAAFLAP